MPVQYNSQKIIPAPQVTIEKQYHRTGEGQAYGTTYHIGVHGRLMATKGSPSSTGSFWTNSGYPPDETIQDSQMLKSILAKQEALRNLFATEGLSFEVQPIDGSMPIKFYPRIHGIVFPEGQWYNDCDYSVSMSADTIEGYINPSGEDSFPQYIAEANEGWQYDMDEVGENEFQPHIFRLTHTVSAVGKRHYDLGQPVSEAWQQAQSYVLSKLGLDMSIILSSGVTNLPTYMSGYNQVRSESINKTAGSFEVVESWTVTSGNTIEDFTVNTTIAIDQGLSHVTIDGTIQGMETRDSNFNLVQSRFQAADARYSGIVSNQMFARAQSYSAVTGLNIIPISEVVGKNPVAGTIHYAFDYNNRPPNFFAGSRSEIITVVDHHPLDIFANIPILGREAGPLLQSIGASGDAQRIVSIELVLSPTGYAGTNNFATWLAAKPDTSPIVAAAKPVANSVFKSQDEESWTPQQARYTRTIGWTWSN